MDFWKSESENGQTNSVLSGMQEFVDSPAVSNNSVEYSSDSVESLVERPKLKLPSKSIQLAKKRLQAYSINSLKAKEAREEKPENTGSEKVPKPYTKTQKTVYPDEVAKAVIRDIELLKKTGFGYGSAGTLSDVSIPEDPVVTLAQVHSDSPSSVSVKSGKVGTFIKREIKCRNIRKSEPYRRRSISPKNQHEVTDSGSKEYPKDWTEYKKLDLNVEKDLLLKSKLFKKSKDRKFTFKTYFNFDAPPVPIESFKVKYKSGLTSSVSFSSLRCTAAKPQILYSANQHKAQPTYLSRDQLFALIPKERMLIIEKLGKPSRCQPFESALAARKWYPKTWKKIDSSEVKLLEKSVGLSFLQGYSDEEEDVPEDNKIVNVEGRNVKIENLDNNASIPSKPEALVETQEELVKIINAKKSRWDDIIETVDPNVSSYDKTPPIEDKEEGEVLSEEEGKCDNAGEYEKAKEQLEKLEATLKTSTELSLEDSNIEKTSEQGSERRKSKKKRKHSDKNYTVKNNHSKRRSYMKSSSNSFESEAETSNRRDKKKKKKYSRPKHEKAKSRRLKNKKPMSKADHNRSESEDIDAQLELEDSLLKKMRKKKKKRMQKIDHNRSQNKDLDEQSELEDNLPKKTRSKRKSKEKSRHSFEPACKASNVENSDTSEQENYEDDIQFFAARFDAETKLKGKSRNKTATIITLEDLSIPHSKLDEKVLKRKSIETEALVLPDAITKKNEDIEKEDTVEIKIDLLKMNEDYLREQKKKEEEKVCTPPNESGIDSDRKMASNADSCLLKEIQCEKEETEKPTKETTEQENNLQTLAIANESQPFDVPNSEVAAKNKFSEPDWDILKNKRKIFKSNDEESTLNENALKNTVNDSCGSSNELLSSAMTMPSLDIVKKEKEDTTIPNTNSWETIIDFQSTKSRSLNLEMPLNIKPFLRREVKIEKDFWDIEEAPTRRSYDNNKKKAHKKIESQQPGHVEKVPDELILTPKKHSDIPCPISTQVKLEADNIVDVDFNNSNTCVTLENEYEEFIKALSTSTEKPNDNESVMIGCSPSKQAKPQIDADSFLIDEYPVATTASEAANLEEVISIPVPDVTPVQISLPSIQPVPAPSPNIEAVIDINKSLINLSVSASVTQNITLSLATSVPSISAPVTSSIDTAKSTFHISTPLRKDNIPLDLNTTVEPNNVVTTSFDSVSNAMSDPKPETFTSQSENAAEEGKCEKLIFTSLTLPSKKLLLGNSKLNLGDSDSEDLNVVEEMKRKKLESLIEDNKMEVLSRQLEKTPVKPFETEIAHSAAKDDNPRKASRGNISPKRYKRDLSPSIRRNRNSPGRRRESSPRRRTFSPRRKSPKRRSPIRKRKSPGRRSLSPKRRRKSLSPRRRRSPLPKNRLSPRRHGNVAPKTKRASISRENRSVKRLKSPLRYRESSPPKRSLADSTISDEQLQQVNNHCHSGKESKPDNYSPRRLSLDDRINEVLGLQPVEHTPQNLPGCDASYYDKTVDQYQFDCQSEPFEHQYSNIQSQVSAVTRRTGTTYRNPQSTYKQVGNMLQIVPTENLTDVHMPYNTDSHSRSGMADYQSCPKPTQQTTPFMMKSKYLQVGNMLQIVPTEMVPSELMVDSGVQNKIKTELSEDNRRLDNVVTEKSSAESSMLLKVAERRAEKENRRQERERRKKEKERRKKAKEKVRQAKLKIKTENMIRKALELEGQDEENMEFELASKLVQWPPIPNISAYCLSKEAGKSILLNNKTRHLKSKKVKLVQFADGIRPGEGTSPSGGEELSSPPPPEKQLLKEKRFKKLKFGKTCVKKKVKVKVIKKLPSPLDESDSDDTLPPPSPPPGSPPSHIFPPRIKVNAVNNVPPPFLASIMHPAQHQQQQQQTPQQTQYQSNMYRPPLNMLLTHPPSIQGHLPSHGPVIAAGLSPQGHYHPGLSVPPPQSHQTGHNHRHY